MASPSWHDELRSAVARHGLPAKYVKRLMDELQDHYSDLMEENPNMEPNALANRLGTPDHLAAVAAAEFRRRTFVGRHPVLTFLVAPIPAVVAFIVATLLLLTMIASLVPDDAVHGEPGLAVTSIFLAAVSWTFRLLPFALLTYLFCRIALRTGCDWRWAIVATLLLALFAGVFHVNYQTPTALPDSGRFMMGLQLPPGPLQLLQFSLPVFIAVVMARRNRKMTVAV